MSANRETLAKAIAKETNLNIRMVDKVLVDFLNRISGALAAGDRVELRGFGTFWRQSRKGHTARNPRLNTPVEVPPHKVPRFRPALPFKKAVEKTNNGGNQ
jgi:nucleoid DNA-binding protein